jgi:hypothetical protein
MKTQAENTWHKMPYTTPNLIPQSFSALAGRMQKRNAGEGDPAGNPLPSRGTQPLPMIIDGFHGTVEEVAAVLESLRWHTRDSWGPAAQALETPPEKSMESMKTEGCILLMDVRRHPFGWRHPLTRIETALETSGTLLLILADSGDDLTTGSRICQSDRWRFSGSITADGIGVLVKSVFKAISAGTESPANPGSNLKISNFRVSPPAHAERD